MKRARLWSNNTIDCLLILRDKVYNHKQRLYYSPISGLYNIIIFDFVSKIKINNNMLASGSQNPQAW